MVEWTARAADQHADLICFPELAITGYPPEDLVLRPTFVQDNLAALETLAVSTAGSSCAVMVGFVDRSDLGLHNAAALIRDGRVEERYHKIQLPNFGVFDEKRYFVPGTAACTIRLASSDLGLSVCEDAWHGDAPFDEYARTGPRVVLNINGSPYHHGKGEERLEIARDRARQTGAWFVYVNAVGGQDELVFDGGSMVVAPDGQVVTRAAMFDEDLAFFELQDLEGGGTMVGRARNAAGPDLAHRPRGGLPSVGARPRRLRAQERVPRGRHRDVRGHRFGAGRHARRGRPGSRGGSPARDAVRVLIARERPGCGGVRESPGCSDRHRADHGGVRRVSPDAGRACSPGPTRTWPRRTSRRASAATC